MKNVYPIDFSVKAEFMTSLGGRIKNRAWRLNTKQQVLYLQIKFVKSLPLTFKEVELDDTPFFYAPPPRIMPTSLRSPPQQQRQEQRQEQQREPAKKKRFLSVKNSSWISGVNYNRRDNALTLRTHNGIYEYHGVARFLFEDLKKIIKDEASVGKWVNENLKGMYKSTKIG